MQALPQHSRARIAGKHGDAHSQYCNSKTVYRSSNGIVTERLQWQQREWMLWHEGRHARMLCHANKGDKKGNATGPDGKADFSAYWSLKVREFFSSRRQYLEGAQEKTDQEPQLIRRLDEKVKEKEQEILKLESAREEAGHTAEQREREADAAAARLTQSLETKLLGAPLPSIATDPASIELRQLQRELSVGSPLQMLSRAQQFLQAAVMAPFVALAAAYKAWQGLFTTQKYEMFLMSEGERIWFWRNRMENERWFWEIFAWDRLIFPTLCTVAYQYVTPANLVWSVIVPFMFIMWQTGRIPGPFNLEFWLVAYFGVYKKCWTDVLRMGSAVLCWA